MPVTDVAHTPTPAMPAIRRVDKSRPWMWLAAGWSDLLKAPKTSLTYGLIFFIAGHLIGFSIWFFDVAYLVLPLSAGFMLLGPILAVGLYDTSRRLEQNESTKFTETMFAWERNTVQIAYMGLLLMLFLLAWIRIATLIFALFFSDNPPRPEQEFIIDVFFSSTSLPFLTTGTIVGAILAVIVFAISAFSIPMLLDRQVTVITAVVASVNAVRENTGAMIIWGVLIVGFTAAGIVIGFLGLVITMPLIAHATWHAYRETIDWGGQSAAATPSASAPEGAAT